MRKPQVPEAKRSGRSPVPPVRAAARRRRPEGKTSADRRASGNGSVKTAKTRPDRLPRSSPAIEAAAVGQSRGKYVYCVIEASDPLRFGGIGIGADPSDVF